MSIVGELSLFLLDLGSLGVKLATEIQNLNLQSLVTSEATF
jgi:hypothetical protein